MGNTVPRIQNNVLLDRQGGEIVVGSYEWYNWLADATSFAYEQDAGIFTARKERFQRGGWYWKAYRRMNGRLQSAYLGASERLTIERLQHIACVLSTKKNSDTGNDLALIDILQSSYQQISHEPFPFPTLPLQDVFLIPKIRTPALNAHLIQRTQLLERLQEAQAPDVILVSAPAGFGKTTILSSWAAHLQTPLAWVSLDNEDNNINRFWLYIAKVLHEASPTTETRTLQLLQQGQMLSASTLITLLSNDLLVAPSTITLVLDDYHCIEEAAIHEAMSLLLHHMPATLRLVLASRTDPPLPLALLRGQGKLLEVRTEDLRFSTEEIQQFFTHTGNITITPEEIVALEAYTEGWVTGLQLTSLLLHHSQTIQQFLLSFTRGNPQTITEYLLDEVFNKQPAHIQQFLQETAILSNMCSTLCDAVRDQIDSWDYLQEIMKLHLFITAIDQDWYHYHPLFAEAVQVKLRRTAPEQFQRLHTRAAHWYESQHLIPEAISHAFLGQNYALASTFVLQIAESVMDRGLLNTVKGWLDAFPENVMRSNPHLCQKKADLLVFTGQFETALQWVQYAEEALAHVSYNVPEIERRTLIGDTISSRSVIIGIQGDRHRAIELSKEALGYYAPSNTETRARVMANIGVMSSELNRFAEAIQMLIEARAIAESGRHLNSVAMIGSRQGTLYFKPGKLHQAAAILRQVLRNVKGSDSSDSLAFEVYYTLGRILYEWNDLDEAAACFEECRRIHALYGGSIVVLTRALALLAMIRHNMHQTGQMQELLNEILHFVYNRNPQFTFIANEAISHCIQLYLLRGEISAALELVQTGHFNLESPLGPYYDSKNLLVVRVLWAQGNQAEALAALERLRIDAENGERWGVVITVLNLQALFSYELEDLETALGLLIRSLGLAAQEQWVRAYLDIGTPMIALLHKLYRKWTAKSSAHPDRQLLAYLQFLLATAEQSGSEKSVSILEETIRVTISSREIEILQLIADGKSNRDIAKFLIIEVNTVKWHIQNIFAKLHVRSRTQLVQKARDCHLIE